MGAEEREEGEGRERDAEERNSRQVYDSPESDPEVLAPSAYLSGNNTAAPQSLNGTEVHLQTIKEGEERTEDAEERNPRQVFNGYEDVPKVLVPSGNLDGNNASSPQSLYCREEQPETLKDDGEAKENPKERNRPQANNDHEDDPEALGPSANLAGNNASSPQSLKGTKEQPETMQEDEERKGSTKERNGHQVNDGHSEPQTTLKGKRQDQNVKERNSRQANPNQDNYPKVIP